MEIITDGNIRLSEELLEKLRKAAALCAENEAVDPSVCEVSLSMVSEDEIRQLNMTYRNVDKATDVLSFPQFDDPDSISDMAEELADGENISLGDVVICEAAALSQAHEYGHSYERELVYLFVHSILHLLGYDHMEEEERAVMRKAEETVMKEIGLER